MVQNSQELLPGVQYVALLDTVLIDAAAHMASVACYGGIDDSASWARWYWRMARMNDWPAVKYLLLVDVGSQTQLPEEKET